jgi:hypothetical protein
MADTLIASMAANVDGHQQSGEIRREGNRFLVNVGGEAITGAPSIGNAGHRLAEGIRRDLPRGNPRDWGVEVHCHSTPGVGLLFGNRRHGGGGGVPNPCVARAQAAYARGDDNLHRALETAARLLADCCQ